MIRLELAAALAGCLSQTASADSSFYPAYFQPGNPPIVVLFPSDGRQATLELPKGLSGIERAVAFSPDGRAIYSQRADPLNRSGEVDKIEFQSARRNPVPGSLGMGGVTCLAFPPSGTLIVAGWSWNYRRAGVFEIDPVAATSRPLPADRPSQCGGAAGVLSPDGRQAVTNAGKELGLVSVESGAVRAIKGSAAGALCSWSPDSRRVACVRDESVIVIDADDTYRAKNFGGAVRGPAEWSPDSKYLLLRTPKSCTFTFGYGESLEILDAETGRSTMVAGSHCRLTAGAWGWMDSSVIP